MLILERDFETGDKEMGDFEIGRWERFSFNDAWM